MTTINNVQPPSQFSRAVSLLQTGPKGLVLRFYDQLMRRMSGAPVWWLSKVEENVYLGGQHGENGWRAMQARGINAVVNMREWHKDDAEKGICGAEYLHLATIDNTPPTVETLERGAKFITEQVAMGHKVYIHCAVGVGRAPTQTAAYLIYNGMSAEDALKKIKRVRPFVHLTPSQKECLQDFEAYIGTKR